MRSLISIVVLGTLLGCSQVDKIPPEVLFTISPPFGDSLTVFSLDASETRDNRSEFWQLKTRWDIHDDGVWETDFLSLNQFAYRFHSKGIHKVTCEVIDGAGNKARHTEEILVTTTRKDSAFIDPSTGLSFNGVFLFNRWWMSRNLDVGEVLDTITIPRDNQLVEKYVHPDDQQYGGFYTWEEATHYLRDTVQGICPDGWRLPRPDDIGVLQEITFFNQYLDEYLGPGGKFGLNLPLSGRYIRVRNVWDGAGYRGNFWVNDGVKPIRFLTWVFYRNSYILNTIYEATWGVPGIEGWPVEWGPFNYKKVALPVRCVKDDQ